MAVEEDGDKKADEEIEEDNKPKKKKPWLLIGGIVFLVTVMLAGTTVGALFYMGMFETEQEKSANSALDSNGEVIKNEEDGVAEDEKDKEEEKDDAEGEDKNGEGAEKKDAVYVPIESTFVVNFEGASKVRFLQITVELMTRDETVVELLTKHMPIIRNNLTFLFSSRTFEEVNSIEGKQQLRASALSEVQKIMEEETGNPAVDALYFTSFVTQ